MIGRYLPYRVPQQYLSTAIHRLQQVRSNRFTVRVTTGRCVVQGPEYRRGESMGRRPRASTLDGSRFGSTALLAAIALLLIAVLAGAADTADAASPSELRKFKSQVQGRVRRAHGAGHRTSRRPWPTRDSARRSSSLTSATTRSSAQAKWPAPASGRWPKMALPLTSKQKSLRPLRLETHRRRGRSLLQAHPRAIRMAQTASRCRKNLVASRSFSRSIRPQTGSPA